MEDDYSFGGWIKRRRKSLGLTQRLLAQQVSCSLATIVKIENDERRPSHQVAELLAEHLEIPEDQRKQFVEAARGHRAVDRLEPIPTGLPQMAPPTTRRRSYILPVSATPLVGRKTELDEITHLLTRSDCRLVNITGPGGVGKTRLALQVAHQFAQPGEIHFPDGIFFVSLVSIQAAKLIPHVTAQVMGFDFSGPQKPEEQLIQYLEQKSLLLLFDNIEHLVDAPEILDRILRGAPNAKLLVTSRERLNLMGEWVYELQGLPVPPEGYPIELEKYDAPKLLLACIRFVKRGYDPTEEDKVDIIRVCHLLDGLPLGIELAANWARTLSIGEIKEEIEHSLDFLTTSARNIPARQRSLRSAFDYSWMLLSSDEKDALCKLSVFRGGFSRQAAELVAQVTLPLLAALVDKSLLRRSSESRFDMHDLIGQFAKEHLAMNSELERETQQRHAQFYTSALLVLSPDLHEDRQRQAVEELVLDIDNIRAAWGFAIAQFETGMVHRAARSLRMFYELRNYYREGHKAFFDAAEVAQGILDDHKIETKEQNGELHSLMTELLLHQAHFYILLDRLPEAELLLHTSVRYLRMVHEPTLWEEVLARLAEVNAQIKNKGMEITE